MRAPRSSRYERLVARSARACVAVTLLLCSVWGTDGQAVAATPPDEREVKVVTAAIAPFVLPQLGAAGQPEGFSVDLWNELARRMGVRFSWSVATSPPALLEAIGRGEADVAIAAIVITKERDRIVDFSLPYFDSGLQIMVLSGKQNAALASFDAIPWAAIGELGGIALLIVFVLANVLWLVERRANPAFQKPYWRAIGEGLWGSTQIMATLGHGDASSVAKRVAIVVMWLLGVVLIAQFTATVTSTQTVQRLQFAIKGPSDLPGKSIGSVPGTVAAEYLDSRGLSFVPVTHAAEGRRMLTSGEIQAIVYDAPTLQYWAAQPGYEALSVVGPVFRPEKYAIAVGEGSALRKPINQALLEVYEDGTYDRIRARWFGRGQ